MAGSFRFSLLLLLAPVICLPSDFLNADGRYYPGLYKQKKKKNSTLLTETLEQTESFVTHIKTLVIQEGELQVAFKVNIRIESG